MGGVLEGDKEESADVAVHIADEVAEGMGGGFIACIDDAGEHEEIAYEFDGYADRDDRGVVIEGMVPGGAGPVDFLEIRSQRAGGQGADRSGQPEDDGADRLVTGAAAAVELKHHVEGGDVLS